MYQRLVPLPAHGFHHAQGGERIDKAGRALGRCGARFQRQALIDTEAAILGVHLAAHHTDGPPKQRLGGSGTAGGNHHAGALIADREGLAQPPGHKAHRAGGNICGQYRALRCPGCAEGGGVGRPHQQGEVRGIDRRGVDTHQHFLGAGGGKLHLYQRNFQGIVIPDQGTQLQAGCCHSKASISMNWPCSQRPAQGVLLSPRRQPMSLQNKRRKDNTRACRWKPTSSANYASGPVRAGGQQL